MPTIPENQLELLYQNYEAPKPETMSGNGIVNDDNNMTSSEAHNTLMDSSLFDANGIKKHSDRTVGSLDNLKSNSECKITMDIDGNGKFEDLTLAEAIVRSHDSELDLYIDSKMQSIIKKYGSCTSKFLSKNALMELALMGIRVDAVMSEGKISNRVYAGTLIDVPPEIRQLMQKGNLTEAEKQKIYDAVYASDAKIMEDENGNLGSCITFADHGIADGYAQAIETEFASALDLMGMDCLSKADYIGKENEYYAMLKRVEQGILGGEYSSSSSFNQAYGCTKVASQAVSDLWGGQGAAPGYHSGGGGSGAGGELSAAAIKELLEKQTQEAEEKEQEENKDLKLQIEAYKNEQLNKKILQYKTENNYQEPTDDILARFEAEIQVLVREKFKISSAEMMS